MRKASSGIAARLRALLPELEYARQTHVEWANASDAALARNPEIGEREFHQRYVGIYDERIAAITEAAYALTPVGDDWLDAEAVERVRERVKRSVQNRP